MEGSPSRVLIGAPVIPMAVSPLSHSVILKKGARRGIGINVHHVHSAPQTLASWSDPEGAEARGTAHCARRRGAQDGASGPFPLLALGRSTAGNLGHSLVAARGEGSEGERMNVRVSGDGAGIGFDLSGSTRDRPMGMDGRQLTDRVAAQVGARLSRPRPTMRPGARSTLCASGLTGRFLFWTGFV
jgi:hypothetical protein